MYFLIGVALILSTAYVVHYYHKTKELKQFQTASQRDKALKEMYKALEIEWYEQNNATNFSVWFENILDAMPQEALKSNATLKIFEDELLINTTSITRDELWNTKDK